MEMQILQLVFAPVFGRGEKEEKMSDLQRFIDAQNMNYGAALEEIKSGRKQSCWMWYVFPQIQGLGHSPTAKRYEIRDLQEAKEYLRNDILRNRLEEICRAALEAESNDAYLVFGSPDDLKLRSSMTLFEAAEPENELFKKVLEKYFQGKRDMRTLKILKTQEGQ